MGLGIEQAVERNAASSYPPYCCAPTFYVEQARSKNIRSSCRWRRYHCRCHLMADPLSIVASAITLGGAVGAAKKTLDKAKTLFKANDELLALMNELTNIQMIASSLSEEVQRRQDRNSLSQHSIATLVSLLDQIKNEVAELDTLVHYRLIKEHKQNGEVKAEKVTWVREQGNISVHRDRLRDLRLDLGLQMNAVAMYGPFLGIHAVYG